MLSTSLPLESAGASLPATPCPATSESHVHALPRLGWAARSWCSLAVASLVVAGLLSLAVVVGRLPVLSRLIDDPLFFKRCLVVHVDLALVVWFYAFVAGLVALCAPPHPQFSRVSFVAAALGVSMMLGGALMRGAQPVLANYIPVIDHALFLSGLGVFFAGVVSFFVAVLVHRRAPAHRIVPKASWIGLQTAAVAVVLAAVAWVAAVAGLPAGVDTWTRYEFTAWGPGHVLQVANVAAMLAVWLWLLERATASPVVSPGIARVLFSLLLAPHLAMPLLTARGTLDPLYYHGATLLMRWTIFPVVMIVTILCVRHLWRHRTVGSGVAAAARAGFAASAGLTVLGMVLGACIRSSTTLVPAHYHASLGGVTAAFMAAAYLVAEAASVQGLGGRFWRAARRQLLLFGVGQAVFALGFAVGGAYGLGRKAYAAEQHVHSIGGHVGLVVMGLGGLVAVAGGLWFLFLILREVRGWWRVNAAQKQPEISTP